MLFLMPREASSATTTSFQIVLSWIIVGTSKFTLELLPNWLKSLAPQPYKALLVIANVWNPVAIPTNGV